MSTRGKIFAVVAGAAIAVVGIVCLYYHYKGGDTNTTNTTTTNTTNTVNDDKIVKDREALNKAKQEVEDKAKQNKAEADHLLAVHREDAVKYQEQQKQLNYLKNQVADLQKLLKDTKKPGEVTTNTMKIITPATPTPAATTTTSTSNNPNTSTSVTQTPGTTTVSTTPQATQVNQTVNVKVNIDDQSSTKTKNAENGQVDNNQGSNGQAKAEPTEQELQHQDRINFLRHEIEGVEYSIAIRVDHVNDPREPAARMHRRQQLQGFRDKLADLKKQLEQELQNK